MFQEAHALPMHTTALPLPPNRRRDNFPVACSLPMVILFHRKEIGDRATFPYSSKAEDYLPIL